MLDSRIGQAAVMTAAIGMVFGMALAPLPNITSKYILADLFDEIDFHYDRHQAAVEATEIVSSPYKPKFKASTYQVTNPVDNPSNCNNTQGDYFQFEKEVFGSDDCQIPTDTPNAYSYSARTYNPQTTDTPARISFYETDENRSNSMYIQLGD